MKGILLTTLTGLGIFFGTPMLNEYAVDPCAAYNNMAVRVGVPMIVVPGPAPDPISAKDIGQILQGATRGHVPPVRQAAPAAKPDPVIGLTCTTRYWQQLTGIGKA